MICGTIGDSDSARLWNERAGREIDMCGSDILLPHNGVDDV